MKKTLTLLIAGMFASVGIAAAAPPTPGTPKAVYNTAVTDPLARTSLSLTFTASATDGSIASYRIYRNDVQINSMTATTSSTQSYGPDAGLTPLTTYTYQVQAVDTAGVTSSLSGELRAAPADGDSADFEGYSPLLEQTTPLADGVSLEYRRFKPLGFNLPENASVKYPVVVFLHGIGECGLNNADQLANRANGAMCFVTARNQATNPCFMIAPQCPTYVDTNGVTKERTWTSSTRQQQIRNIVEGLSTLYPGRIDNRRYYAVGLSYGSIGTWSHINSAPNYWAAAVPLTAINTGNVTPANVVHMPIWTYHCHSDDIISSAKTQETAYDIRLAGGNVHISLTEGGGHGGGWTKAFNDPQMVEWLMAQRRETDPYQPGASAPATPPAVNGRAAYSRRVPSLTIVAPTRDNAFKTASTTLSVTAQIASGKAKIQELGWWSDKIVASRTGVGTGVDANGSQGADLVNGSATVEIESGNLTSALVGSMLHVNDYLAAKIMSVTDATHLVVDYAPQWSRPDASYSIYPPGHYFNPMPVTITSGANNNTYIEQTITGIPLSAGVNKIGVVARDSNTGFSDNTDTYIGDTIVVTQDAAIGSLVLSANAGSYPNQYGASNVVVNLDGTILDNGASVTTGATWTQLDGPAAVVFGSTTAVDTTATLPVPGTYRVKLTALNGARLASDVVQLNLYPSTPSILPSLKYAIESGGAWYTTTEGVDYTTDQKTPSILTGTSTVEVHSREVRGTHEDAIYRTLRTGTSFGYALTVPSGNYDVKLKFADFTSKAAGARIFNVNMEGVNKVSNLDLFSTVGRDGAHDVAISNVSVTDGTLNIDFAGVTGSAVINGIVVTQSASAPAYFSQDFAAGGVYTTYIQTDGTQQPGKFNDISGETAAETWSIAGNALKLHRSASSTNGAGFMRYNPATGNPNVMDYRCTLSVDFLTGTTSNDLGYVDVGSFTAMHDYNANTSLSLVANRLTVDGAGTSGYRLLIGTATTPNYADGTTVTLRWLSNQSGVRKEYVRPDNGQLKDLDSGYSDLWVNGSLVLSNALRSTGSGSLMGALRFRSGMNLDHDIVFDAFDERTDTLLPDTP